VKIQKLTPTHTLDWYIKWVASFVLIVGVILTSNNVFPANLIFHALGMFGWFIVGILWNDRALIVINAVTLALMSNGLITYYVK
jgi:energy-coupling factor transporter transmembrane protein EcfT|tara:strand:- start:456 stop:707 length:252 start_codon:yes stop_codon:yes gene_type:complete